jgi:alpha-1,6-mannosyltransferase
MLAALSLACLIKLPIASLLPLFALAAWRLEPLPRRRRLLMTGTLVVLGIAVVSYLVLPQGLWGLAGLQYKAQSFTHSLPAVLERVLALAAGDSIASTIVDTLALLAIAVYWLLQLRNVYRNPPAVVRLAFNTLLFLLLLSTPWFQPWYLLWIMPLAAVYPRPDAPFQAALFALCVAWTYAVYGFVWFWIIPFANWGHYLGIELIALTTTYTLPWAYAGIQGWRHRRAAGLFDLEA